MTITFDTKYVPQPKSNDQAILATVEGALDNYFVMFQGDHGELMPEAFRNITPLELLVLRVFSGYSEAEIEYAIKAAAELPPYVPSERYVPTAEEVAKWATQKDDEW